MIGLGAWPNLTGGRVGGHGFALATESPFGTVFLGLWALQGLASHAKIIFQVSTQVGLWGFQCCFWSSDYISKLSLNCLWIYRLCTPSRSQPSHPRAEEAWGRDTRETHYAFRTEAANFTRCVFARPAEINLMSFDMSMILDIFNYLMICTAMNYSTRLFADERRHTAEGNNYPIFWVPDPKCFPSNSNCQYGL